jgi:hypothetical protein
VKVGLTEPGTWRVWWRYPGYTERYFGKSSGKHQSQIVLDGAYKFSVCHVRLRLGGKCREDSQDNLNHGLETVVNWMLGKHYICTWNTMDYKLRSMVCLKFQSIGIQCVTMERLNNDSPAG